MKKLFFALIIKAFLVSSVFGADKVTLTIHSFQGPKAPTYTKFLNVWAKAVEKQSDGKIEVKVFPSMSLGGKPPELYKQVRDGSVDLVWTVTGYTPGVFPRTEVFELPTVHTNSAVATNMAIQDEFELLADDYKDVHPILVHVHAGNAIHTTTKKINKVSDLKGLKLRSPTRTGVWLIEELGAEPVGMPLPALPQALSKNAVDGALIPYEVFPPLKFHQLTHHSLSLEGDSRFGTSVFLFAMNKDRYNKLSPELKKVIDNNSGRFIAKDIGQVWMDSEAPGIKMQKNSKKSTVAVASAKITKDFNKVGQKVVNKWIKEMDKKGIDGKTLVKKARAAIARYE